MSICSYVCTYYVPYIVFDAYCITTRTHAGIIALVTVYTVIIKEGNIIEGLKLDAGWDPQKMFSDSTYLRADDDFISFVKYIFKYGFYRYGIEVEK